MVLTRKEVKKIMFGNKRAWPREVIVYKMRADTNGYLYVPTAGYDHSDSARPSYDWIVSVDDESGSVYTGTASSNGTISLGGYTNGSEHTIKIEPRTEEYGWALAYGWDGMSKASLLTEIIYDGSYMGYAVSATETGDYFRIFQYQGCSSLINCATENIPNTVTTIGNYFRYYQYFNCSSIVTLADEVLPNSVTSIGNDFRREQYCNCDTAINAAVESLPNSVVVIGNNFRYKQYRGCLHLTNPAAEVLPNSVVSIGDGFRSSQYESCSNLLTAAAEVLPNSVTSLGGDFRRDQYDSCYKITVAAEEIFPDSITNILNGFRYGQYSYTAITNPVTEVLPNTVTYIGNDFRSYQYYHCTSLTTTTPEVLPNSVTSVGDNFRKGQYNNCSLLTTPTPEILPDSVESIGNGFRYGQYKACAALTTTTPEVLPNTITSVGDSFRQEQYQACTSLTTPAIEVLSSSITSIGSHFRECQYLGCTSLTTTTPEVMLNAITSVGDSFRKSQYNQCSSLIAPAAEVISSIGNVGSSFRAYQYAFCRGLITPAVEELNSGTRGDNFRDSQYKGCSSLTSAAAEVLPGGSGGVGTRFRCEQYKDCTSLTTPAAEVFPYGAASFPGYYRYAQYMGCTSLTSAAVEVTPNYDNFTGVGQYFRYQQYSGCTSLTTPAAEVLNDYIRDVSRYFRARQYEGCTSLTTAAVEVLPDSVQDIDEYFRSNQYDGCTSLSAPAVEVLPSLNQRYVFGRGFRANQYKNCQFSDSTPTAYWITPTVFKTGTNAYTNYRLSQYLNTNLVALDISGGQIVEPSTGGIPSNTQITVPSAMQNLYERDTNWFPFFLTPAAIANEKIVLTVISDQDSLIYTPASGLYFKITNKTTGVVEYDGTSICSYGDAYQVSDANSYYELEFRPQAVVYGRADSFTYKDGGNNVGLARLQLITIDYDNSKFGYTVKDNYRESQFRGCSNLQNISTGGIRNPNITAIPTKFRQYQYLNCSSLNQDWEALGITEDTIDDFSHITSSGDYFMYHQYDGCYNLTSAIPEAYFNWTIGNNHDFRSYQYNACSSLSKAELVTPYAFPTGSQYYRNRQFTNCGLYDPMFIKIDGGVSGKVEAPNALMGLQNTYVKQIQVDSSLFWDYNRAFKWNDLISKITTIPEERIEFKVFADSNTGDITIPVGGYDHSGGHNTTYAWYIDTGSGETLYTGNGSAGGYFTIPGFPVGEVTVKIRPQTETYGRALAYGWENVPNSSNLIEINYDGSYMGYAVDATDTGDYFRYHQYTGTGLPYYGVPEFLPITVTTIGDHYCEGQYMNCTDLGYNLPSDRQAIFELKLSTVTSIGDNFKAYQCYGCSGLIYTSNEYNSDSLTSIGNNFRAYQYCNCNNLQVIRVTNTNTNAFEDLNGAITSIGDNFRAYQYSNCQINYAPAEALPDTVTSIGDNFRSYQYTNCASLVTAPKEELPDNIVSIGDYFRAAQYVSCTSLSFISGWKDTNVGGNYYRDYQFNSCTTPKSITVLSDVGHAGEATTLDNTYVNEALVKSDYLANFTGSNDHPWVDIDDYKFGAMPEEKIVYKMIADNDGLVYVPKAGANHASPSATTLTTVSFSWNIKVTDQYGNVVEDTQVSGTSLKKGVISLGAGVCIAGDTYTIEIRPQTEEYGWALAYCWYNVTQNGNLTEVIYDGSYMGYASSATDTGAYFRASQYYGCASLTTIPLEYLPNTVTTIGNYFRYYQYRGCIALTSPAAEVLPSSVTTIGNYYRSYMYGYSGVTSAATEVMGDSVTSIGTYFRAGQYYNCTSLATTSPEAISNSLTSLSNDFRAYQYRGCTSLTTPAAEVMPSSVTTIGTYFRETQYRACSSLTTTTPEVMPNTVTSIGNYFRSYQYGECTSLTIAADEALSTSLTSVGTYFRSNQYYGDSSLTTSGIEYLPSTLTTIGNYFRNQQYINCTSLVTIPGWYESSTATTGTYYRVKQYNGCTSNKTVKVLTNYGSAAYDSNVLQNSYVTEVQVPNQFLNDFINCSRQPWSSITDSKFVGYNIPQEWPDIDTYTLNDTLTSGVSGPHGIAVSRDGTHVAVGAASGEFKSYTYSSGTLTYDNQTSSSYNTRGLYWNDDGTVLYSIADNNIAYQCVCSTPYDLSTATVTSTDISSITTYLTGVLLTPDSNYFYTCRGNDVDSVIYKVPMTIAGDISSFTTTGVTSFTDSALRFYNFAISPTGLKMFVGDWLNSPSILQYNLSTPRDITTATYSGKSISVSGRGTISVTEDGTIFQANTNDSNGSINIYTSQGWQPGVNTVAYYPFREDILDHSGNNNNFTGGTYSFSNNKITITSTLTGPIVTPENTIGDRTINMRVNSDSNGATYSFRSSFWGTDGFLTPIEREIDGRPGASFKLNSWYRNRPSASDLPVIGSTILMTWIKTGATMKLYINGTLTSTTTIDSDTWSGESTITKSQIDPGTYGEIIVEDKAWTDQEILDYLNQAKSLYGIS